jgi:hypothetical protein
MFLVLRFVVLFFNSFFFFRFLNTGTTFWNQLESYVYKYETTLKDTIVNANVSKPSYWNPEGKKAILSYVFVCLFVCLCLFLLIFLFVCLCYFVFLFPPYGCCAYVCFCLLLFLFFLTFSEVIEAMRFLESKQISHGRLKPEDIMVTRDASHKISIKIHNFATQGSVVADLRNFGQCKSINK